MATNEFPEYLYNNNTCGDILQKVGTAGVGGVAAEGITPGMIGRALAQIAPKYANDDSWKQRIIDGMNMS